MRPLLLALLVACDASTADRDDDAPVTTLSTLDFERPALTPGSFLSASVDPTVFPDGFALLGDSADAGVLRPTTELTATEPLADPAGGNQAAYLSLGATGSETIASIYIPLLDDTTADTEYAVTIAEGQRLDRPLPTYVLQLLEVDDADEVIVLDSGERPASAGGWSSNTLTGVAGSEWHRLVLAVQASSAGDVSTELLLDNIELTER